MHAFDDIQPLGGLNSDDEVRALPKGDYLIGTRNIRNAINQANKGGALTNVLGNLKITQYTCPYNNNSLTFPAGRNKCIGAVEELNSGGALFFVWNSNGAHGIYRYFRYKTSPLNPYGVVEQVIQYDFGWKKGTRITSMNLVYGDPDNNGIGDLLYWCDRKPRKINYSKGNVVGKLKSWDVFLPETCSLPAIINFTFKNFSGATIHTTTVGLSDPTNRTTIIADITAYINGLAGVPVTAESCGDSLVLTEKVTGTVWTITVDTNQMLVSPDNWYGDTLIERFFDRCKYPPLQAPQATYLQDSNVEYNYVQKKVFQFRLEYFYDDREPSVLGVWSQIPIDNLGCDGTSNVLLNYVDVNFNDPLVVDKTTLVLLKKIRFVARELNTGANRSVIDLYPSDFLDFATGNFFAHYKFYNDIISSAIDDATSAKILDDVPLEVGAEQLKDNRIIEADCLTGYNAPDCIDAKPQMEFGDKSNTKLHKVKFKVRVMTFGLGDGEQAGTARNFVSMFPNLHKYPFWEPGNPTPASYYTMVQGGIFHDTSRTTNNFAFFGGGGFGAGAGGDFGIRAGMEDVFDQRCPEGGFPVYAAGTPYFAVSKQVSIGLPADGDGALVTTTVAETGAIGTYLYAGGALYSEVELLVPDGEYVFRVASHWCSFGDKLTKGFMYDLSAGTNYQKTSTNVCGTKINFIWHKNKEIKVTVNGADILDAGDFIVMDLAPPWDANTGGSAPNDLWSPFNMYLYDSSDGTQVNSDPNSATFEGVSVEKSLVLYNYNPSVPTYSSNFYDDSCTTDHNGYFFGIGEYSWGYFQYRAYQTGGLIADTGIYWLGSLSDLFNKVLVATTPPTNTTFGLIAGVVVTTTATARSNSSTKIEGTIVDSLGGAVPNATVIYESGRTTLSVLSGAYTMIAWGDAVTCNLPNFPAATPISNTNNRTVDNLIFELSIFCVPSYPNGQEYSPVSIDPFGTGGGGYNPSNPYLIPDFIINEGNNPSVKAHKRGGNYTYGLRLYDNAGRLCSVVKAFEMYVPFITEDIGKYSIEDFSGVVYPANTFKYGKPSIKWVLDALTTFPTWATTFQWMRVKNSIYGRYLQWVANQVTYLSATATVSTPEIQTSFQNADAVAIKVSLSNITSYYAANNNSQIGYQYLAGDRLRLIANRSLVNYQGLTDFEITSYDATTQSVIIKPNGFPTEIQSGTLFEIFNPKSVETTDEQIYYEVGEVVNIVNGIPAKFSGVFTNGDTYWRGRLIIVNDDATKFASAYPVVIEDASVSDFYVSEAQDIGRIGIIDPNFKQVRRPMLLKVSDQFIPSTAVNGLSSFNALNETELDRANGQIQRLVSINQTVVAISSVRETSNYIQVVQFNQANLNDPILAISEKYFGTQYPHTKTLGTDLPGSVFINDGIIFGIHSGRSDAWRYQGDGEQAISDVKMKNFFQQLGNDGVSDAISVYDRFHEEYIVTLWRKYKQQTTIATIQQFTPKGYLINVILTGSNNIETYDELPLQYLSGGIWVDLVGTVVAVSTVGNNTLVTLTVTSSVALALNGQVNVTYSIPESIKWFNGNESIQKQRWVSASDIVPENYVQVGSEVGCFKNGELWLNDKNPVYNNFFGVQYNTQIVTVFNEKPEVLKVWNAAVLRTLQSNFGCDWSSPLITNDNQQQSRLVKGSFVKKAENFYASFKRDLSDPTVTNPIVNGRVLRSSSLTVTLVNDYTGEVLLYSWSANFTPSYRSFT